MRKHKHVKKIKSTFESLFVGLLSFNVLSKTSFRRGIVIGGNDWLAEFSTLVAFFMGGKD